MEITAQWLALWENGELSDEVLAAARFFLLGQSSGPEVTKP
jgi:hypothetical protein